MSLDVPDGRSCLPPRELPEALRLAPSEPTKPATAGPPWPTSLGVRQESLSHWFTAFAREGPDSLRVRPAARPIGTHRWLTPIQEEAALAAVLNDTPTAHGGASLLWTRAAVGALIEHQSGARLPVRTVGEYLKRWGFNPQRPVRRAYRQDPDAVQR